MFESTPERRRRFDELTKGAVPTTDDARDMYAFNEWSVDESEEAPRREAFDHWLHRVKAELLDEVSRLIESEWIDSMTISEGVKALAAQHRGRGPILVHWQPRWEAPTVRAACPSCGRVADRRASSWKGWIDGTVEVTSRCTGTPGCWRTFTVTVPGVDPPSETGANRG